MKAASRALTTIVNAYSLGTLRPCVHSTVFECRARLFDHLKQIYETLWCELTELMTTLEPLLPILRAIWNEQKYKAEATSEKTAGQDLAPSEVAKVLEDNCFSVHMFMLLLLAFILEGLG